MTSLFYFLNVSISSNYKITSSATIHIYDLKFYMSKICKWLQSFSELPYGVHVQKLEEPNSSAARLIAV